MEILESGSVFFWKEGWRGGGEKGKGLRERGRRGGEARKRGGSEEREEEVMTPFISQARKDSAVAIFTAMDNRITPPNSPFVHDWQRGVLLRYIICLLP